MSQGRGILVLCTGNSCRSQMAAAYLEKYAGDRFEVLSAGTEPAAEVHPMAVAVMAEEGLDLSGRKPVDYRDLLGQVSVYYLVIVCDGAAESCPSVWPGVSERLVWPFEDPASFVGDEQATRRRFREVRDAIHGRVRAWVADPGPPSGPC